MPRSLAEFYSLPHLPLRGWSTPTKGNEGAEYAPLYTTSEKLRLFSIHSCWLAPTLASWHYYLQPKIKELTANSGCYEFLSITGVKFLFFGVFVVLPLMLSAVIFLTQGLRSIRAFRTAQFPPPNEKTFRLTKYSYGRAAKSKASIYPSIIIFFLGLGVWGEPQAYDLTKEVKPCNLTSR